MLKVELARFLDGAVGAVLRDAVLKMFADAVARHVRQVGLLKLELGIIEQRRGGLLDDPHPEVLAAQRRAVQVHQHRLDGPVDLHVVHGIVSGVAQGRIDQRQHVRLERDKLDLAIARRRDGNDAIATGCESAVACLVERHQSSRVGSGGEAIGDQRRCVVAW